MQNLKELSRGWRSMRKSITELIARVNALSNQTIARVEANSDGEAGTAELLEVGEKSSILKLNSDPSAVATGTPSVLPFTGTLDAGSIAISAGRYVIANAATAVSALGSTSGSYAYIKLKQSSAGVLDATTPFTLEVTSSSQNEITFDSGSTYVEFHRTLIAEVSGGVLLQHRSGNAELVEAFTSGQFYYAPIFAGGSA